MAGMPASGSAEACAAGGLGGRFALPLSTLPWQHARTFHAVSLGDEGCPQAICSGFPRIRLHPLPIPIHGLASALQQIAVLPPGTSPTCWGISLPSICDNYREAKKQINSHSKNQGQAQGNAICYH